MGNQVIRYCRRFDWFQLVYSVFLLGLFYVLIHHFGENPFEVPVFWLLTGLLIVGQGLYFLIAMRSPNQFELTEHDFVVGWPKGDDEISVPRDLVHIRRSYLITGGYWVTAGSRSFYLLPGPRNGRDLVDALLEERVQSS